MSRDDTGPVLLLSATFALLPVLLAYVLRWRLGRGPVVPAWMFPVLLVLGAIGGIAMPLTAMGELEALLAPLGASFARPPFFGAVVGAVAEELGKALILLAFVPTRWFRSTIDGLLYGFVAGAGFAAAENFLYFISAYATAGPDAWTTSVLVRLVPSTVVHGGATAMVGAFLGAIRWERRLVLVFAAPCVGLALASLLHGAWNGLLHAAATTTDTAYESVALALLPATVTLLGLLLAAAMRLEAGVLRTELAAEVDAGWLTADELESVSRRSAGRSLVGSMGSVRLLAAATALAYARRRARMEGRDLDDVERWRAKLHEARSGRPWPADPEAPDQAR